MRGQTRAEAIARAAHAGQVDKTGHPYIDHPARVAARVQGNAQLEAIAWLHDVVEDTTVTLDDLRREFPDEIVDAVDALTKRPGETRQDYYARVRQNTRALQVKHADIDDNTDPARTALLDETTRARLAQKYAAAREALADV
ncbi:HD domain-containing protein [Microbacterium xylanilyticum]